MIMMLQTVLIADARIYSTKGIGSQTLRNENNMKENEIEKVIREIIRRGNNAEVRQDKSGKLVVYEIEKKKRYIDGV